MGDEVDLEEEIYIHQEKLIKARFGKEAARLANYGWGVVETEEGISLATKVYVVPTMILTTEARWDGSERSDEWRSY